MLTTQGYPEILLPIVLFGGLLLAIIRPYAALCVAIFMLTAMDRTKLTFTRTTTFGAYFNLADAIILVMLFSLFVFVYLERKTAPGHPRSLHMTRELFAVIAILIVGIVTIWARSGNLSSNILREIRFSLNFPIGFFVLLNFFSNEKNDRLAKPLFTVFLLAAGIASFQHILVVARGETSFRAMIGVDGVIRTINFTTISPIIIASAPFLRMDHLSKFGQFTYYILVGVLGISVLLTQTRSLLIAVVFTTLGIIFLTRNFNIRFLATFIVLIGAIWVSNYVLDIDTIGVATRRFDSLDSLLMGEANRSLALRQLDSSRTLQLEYELKFLREGNWVTGLGIGFPNLPAVRYTTGNQFVAWGHIGYVAYLSRLGVLGLIVFAIYLPFKIVNYYFRSRNLTRDPYSFNLSILSLTTVLYYGILGFLSGSYLDIDGIFPGIFYGILAGIWLKSQLKMKSVENSEERVFQPVELSIS